MMSPQNTKALSYLDKLQLIEFFLYEMGQDQRGRLMGRYPVIYKTLFPGVADADILRVVGMALGGGSSKRYPL